ncbi:MAG: hypothetical protein GC192_13450 [Bacteroidetes bacterium]|nr:hypothetical protein [Bacteroidota bacterium]
MRCLFILPILLFFSQFLSSQNGAIYLENPSFEGVPSEGGNGNSLPKGWQDCGFPGETPPDVHPKPGIGAFQVTKEPMDGRTYLGLVTRENDTWEMVSQKLEAPLKIGGSYAFSIGLCRSEIYLSASRISNKEVNYAAPVKLRIWGGNKYCERKELLAESELITNKDWKRYNFIFTPSNDIKYIILEAFYKTPTPFPYNGNLLIDNASAIIPIDESINIDSLKANNITVGILDNNREKDYDESYYSDLKRYEFFRPLMGTEFHIVIYHRDSLVAKQAAEKAFQRVAVLEKVFSDYMENSEVSWLSDAGKATNVSDELWTVLKYSQEVAERSEGAFDVSIGALSKLWRRAIREKEFPSEAEVGKAAATVGYKDIEMKGRNKSIKLDKEGMRLDFGGIAKGYAIDEAMAWLKVSDIRTALVDGGGDVLVGMPPPGKEGWEIEVPDKMVNGELVFKKSLFKNTAIATSGDTYRYLEHDGKRYSHIIDPRTGYGLTNRRVVTVTAPTCMAADAWATAASIGIKKLLTVDLRDKENTSISILEE